MLSCTLVAPPLIRSHATLDEKLECQGSEGRRESTTVKTTFLFQCWYGGLSARYRRSITRCACPHAHTFAVFTSDSSKRICADVALQ